MLSIIDDIVHRFTAHAHRTHVYTHTHAHLISDHVSPRKNEHTMSMFGVHRRVVCSCWICAICRFRSIALRNPQILENLQIVHPSADCAPICRLRRSSKCAQQMRWSFDENRLHQFFGPDFQDINWHFYRSKFKLSYRFNTKRHQNAPWPT